MTDVSIYFYITIEDWKTVLLSEEHAALLADLYPDYTGRSEGGDALQTELLHCIM